MRTLLKHSTIETGSRRKGFPEEVSATLRLEECVGITEAKKERKHLESKMQKTFQEFHEKFN